MKRWCLMMLTAIAPTIFFVGCAATRQDFDEMSLPERQAAVCYEAAAFKQRKQQMAFYEEAIEDKQELLSRGYRVHTSCQMVTVALPAKDCSGMSDLAAAFCRGEPTTKQERRCVETPVTIDPEFEKKELESYRLALSNLSAQHISKTQSCFVRVAEMPPEAAYVYYAERMEPQAGDKVEAPVPPQATTSSPSPANPSGTASTSDYAGQMSGGKRHGTGTQKYPNGDKYYGSWRDDLQHGEGTYFYKDGRVYEGNWVDGQLDGYVIQTFPNGEVYDGFMREGAYHGYGVLTCTDGTTYDFYWENDKMISGTMGCPSAND